MCFEYGKTALMKKQIRYALILIFLKNTKTIISAQAKAFTKKHIPLNC